MSADHLQDATSKIISELNGLRRYRGTTQDFWTLYVSAVSRLTLARICLVAVQTEEDGVWTAMMVQPQGSLNREEATEKLVKYRDLAEEALQFGYSVNLDPGPDPSDRGWIGVQIETGEGHQGAVLFLQITDAPVEQLQASAVTLRMVADVPATFQTERALNRAAEDVVRFGEALEIMALLNSDNRYIKTVMTLCNELAARYRCSRVSVGWQDGDYIIMQALSHMENFEKRTTAIQTLEACMQESLDQDEEILWPVPQESTSVARAHEEYTRKFGTGALISLPIRVDGQPLGVLTCERADHPTRSDPATPSAPQPQIDTRPFNPQEVLGLRLVCDQAARRLCDLKATDRWFGARLWSGFIKSAGWFLGVENTLEKLGGILLAILMWFFVFGTWTYRVEGSFVLKTDDIRVVPAPFTSYLEDVHFKVGDAVNEGDILARLDTRELLQDESAAEAEVERFSREAEKSQAKRALSEMKISQALEAQAQARLDKVRFELDSALIKAPISGIIVEGDLERMLGAPVRTGDMLFQIAQITTMYIAADVNEEDIHDVQLGQSGEAAFVSRPNVTCNLSVVRIDPTAHPKQAQNNFAVRCSLEGKPEEWFRPGMSGIVKLNCGDRPIWWIAAHRTIDFLSLYFWM